MNRQLLRANVATPDRLPSAEGGLHPEWVRKAYANEYANLQKFKLKVVIGLFILVMVLHYVK